ncbi:GNAT family N-acetyltransferase [Marinicella rhabdoformis]|uniref:GNAT family N-acetyltransferase n=1 Tax=Marinicella rhabdoformis TaxID=2580566 RepID=UPI0012AEC671|nr:GNAT family N-acetyltransferase [Marinicella rhabdoformis]
MKINLLTIISGNKIKLRPLSESDFDALYQVASDPEIWAQHPASNRYQEGHFRKHFFMPALESQRAFVIIDKLTEQVIGSSRYYDIDPEKQSIAIGYTFIGRDYWGKGTNKELKDLMINHVSSWAKVIWFHVAKQNQRSRKAVEKLGAVLTQEEDSFVDGVPFTRLHYKLNI